jgi:hypothetical protein
MKTANYTYRIMWKKYDIDPYIFLTKMMRSTAVAPGTVGMVPTVPLCLAGTANRTTISTEKNYFEMKKLYSLLMSL